MLFVNIILFICSMILGIFAYGLSLAFFQKKFLAIAKEYKKSDVFFSLLVGFCGILGFLVL